MDPQDDDYLSTPIVMLREEGVMGVVLEEGPHASLIKYLYGGIEYIEYVENDDFVVIDAILFEYVDEDED